MSQQPDPSDVHTSGRAETQPASEEATDEFADQAERIEKHSGPAGDSVAMHGPAGHAERDQATAGRGPDDPHRVSNETDATPEADQPQPPQPHPESSEPSRPAE